MNRLRKIFKDKKKRNWLIVVLIIVVAALIGLQFYFPENDEVEEQSFSSFVTFMETDKAKNMTDVVMDEALQTLSYTYEGKEYTVKLPRGYFTDYFTNKSNKENIFRRNGTEVEFKPVQLTTSGWVIFFEFIILLLFTVIVAYYIFRQFIMPKRTDIEEVKNELTTFKDIAGYDYVKEELMEIVDFLKYPQQFSKYTKRIPKGVLLEGPPGNGKTLFAKAIAGETGTPFFHISASDIEDKYVGAGAQKINKIFKKVRKRAEESGCAILFIDEIDAVGTKREMRTLTETNQTINKLLTEMDGFNKDSRVIVIAATNLSSSLDAALIRSGRFDRIITIDKPNLQEREAILQLYLNQKGDLIHKDVNQKNYPYVLAQQTEGFSNADLDKLVNEASLIARKREESQITIQALRESFTKIIAGPQTNRALTEEDKKIIAYHEAGHAAAQILTSPEGYKSVAYITITPYGKSLGHVSPVSRERVLLKKSDLQNQLMVTLAGRAVEEKILNGDYTTGAAADLQQANSQLLMYITKYGMDSNYQNLFIERQDENNDFTQKLLVEARKEIYNSTKALLSAHFDVVEKIAEYLLGHTSIAQHELPAILRGTSYERVKKQDEYGTSCI
ncbi:AAA family ATPase [Pseudobacillus badius]|uniref:AAA family ATPase n=1 Tax=Bacillus badius TaxID=1455 RepID=UPI003D33CA8E